MMDQLIKKYDMVNHILSQFTRRLRQFLSLWVQRSKTVDDLRAEAGLHAEEVVRQLLDAYCLENPEFRVIHNGKFEFNIHTGKPTRLEIDHLLITDKTIFIIETKYKSGEITALEFESRWSIKNGDDLSTMANALKQAKRQNSILKKHFDTNIPIVPLVAIVGNTTLKRHNIHHVCVPEQLPSLISMFNLYRQSCIDISATFARLRTHLYA